MFYYTCKMYVTMLHLMNLRHLVNWRWGWKRRQNTLESIMIIRINAPNCINVIRNQNTEREEEIQNKRQRKNPVMLSLNRKCQYELLIF